MKFIDVGYGNMVCASRIISVVAFESAPIKRLCQDAKEKGNAIDVTCGHKCQSVIITDSKHVILSAIDVATLTDTDNKVSDEQN